MSDFSLPDFTVPELQATDLMVPDFTLSDVSMPDPPLPALMQPAIPPDLDVLASSARAVFDAEHPSDGIPVEVPEMSAMPGTDAAYDPTQDMPGTLNNVGLSLVLDSLDNQQLPSNLAYDNLNSTPDMTTRERHLGMLLLGLEGKVPGEGAEGTGQ